MRPGRRTPFHVRLGAGLGSTLGNHEAVGSSQASFGEAAGQVHGACRVLRVYGEGHLSIAVRPGCRKRGLHHGPAKAAILKPGLQCNAELGSLIVDVCETLTTRNQAHPACARVLSVHHCDNADICAQAPALNKDPYSRVLKYLYGTQWSRRRVPERDVKPAPQALLVGFEERAESHICHSCAA